MTIKSNIPFITNSEQMHGGTTACEIDAEWYWSIFEAVPPLYFNSGCFVCGEPYGHKFVGNYMVLTYSLYCNTDGRCFYLGEIIQDDINNISAIIRERLYE